MVRIIRAKKNDSIWISQVLIEVQKLHNAHHPLFFNAPDEVTPQQLIMMIQKRFFAKGWLSLIAKERNSVIWFIAGEFKKRPKHPIRKQEFIGMIDTLWVKKEYQKTWLWTQLIEKFESIAKKKWCTRLELQVWNFNNWAKKFYKKQNFDILTQKLTKFI